SAAIGRHKLSERAVADISVALTVLIADLVTIHLKAKSFSWHFISGPSDDYRLLLERHAEQVFSAIDLLATRVREIGGTTIRSVGHVKRLQRIIDNDSSDVTAHSAVDELREDNQLVSARLRDAHKLCVVHGDQHGAQLVNWLLDEAEHRATT